MTPYQQFVVGVECSTCEAPVGELCRYGDAVLPKDAARVHLNRVGAANARHAEQTGVDGHAWTLVDDGYAPECTERCQYAQDVSMSEHACFGRCWYLDNQAPASRKEEER